MNLTPTIVVDTREQEPLVFRTLSSVTGSLTTGDYSVRGVEELFAIERKSIPDLVACCMGVNRERFERELHRLRGFRFARLLVVGAEADIEQHRYRSAIQPKSVLHTLRAFEARYDIAVVFEPDVERAAELVERWAYWFSREVLRTADAIREASTRLVLTVPSETLPPNDLAVPVPVTQ